MDPSLILEYKVLTLEDQGDYTIWILVRNIRTRERTTLPGSGLEYIWILV